MKVLTGKDNHYMNNKCIADVIECHLKNFLCDDGCDIEVGTFDNCREYGNTYRPIGAKQDYTFCVYEHRNSDEIIINGCPTSEIAPYGPYSGKSKFDCYASFSCNQYYDAAEQLFEMLNQCFTGDFKDKFRN